VLGLIVAAGILRSLWRGFACVKTSALAEVRESRMAMGHDGSLGEVLRAVREARGWAQAEAGRRIGVARNTISRWELGQPKPTAI
jgi:DNA-binding transcriptional regulator YiaG